MLVEADQVKFLRVDERAPWTAVRVAGENFACSVSRSQVARVTQYISNQREHHKKIDSEEEFRILLKKHGFEYHV